MDQAAGGSSGGEIMLFGVRVVVDSMRKSVSLNNLSQYEHRLDSSPPISITENKELTSNVAAGYASADDVIHQSSTTTTNAAVNRERKRGVPWTEDEHKLFLLGLQKVGKGDWRGISRNFVKTRTPTQVASHAQKYFLRRNNLNRRRRRSSLFDITTDSVAANNGADDQMIKKNTIVATQSQSPPPPSSPPQRAPNSEISNEVKFSVSPTPIYQFSTSYNQQVVPAATTSSSKSMTMVDFDLNNSSSSSSFDPSPALSLNLSLSLSTGVAKASSSRNNRTFPVMQGFRNGDAMISVA